MFLFWFLFLFGGLCHAQEYETVAAKLDPQEMADLINTIYTVQEKELLSQKLEKRSPFSAWGGKRSSAVEEDLSRDIRGPGNSFSAWGGKRSDDRFDDRIRRELYARAAKRLQGQPKYRRAAFSAWGGK